MCHIPHFMIPASNDPVKSANEKVGKEIKTL